MADTRYVRPRTDAQLPASADPLSEVLQLLQLNGVLYCNAELTEPWGIEIPALEGVMNVEVVTTGHCWLEVDGEAPLYMPEGSMALIPRGRRHQLRANPGDRTTRLEDIPIERYGERFERMVFGAGGQLTRITYFGVRFDAYLADRLIRHLPEVLHLRTQEEDSSWLNNTIRFIASEAHYRRPGNETIITRLADVLVIQAIRSWLDSVRNEERGWIAALHDRYIGQAMSLMHHYPEKDWQVETLAHAVGLSRSGFSARFTAIAGESVLSYLTSLRMQLAHRELQQTSDTLAIIAERVGYHSEPAFNRAFKRIVGKPPGAVRKGLRRQPGKTSGTNAVDQARSA